MKTVRVKVCSLLVFITIASTSLEGHETIQLDWQHIEAVQQKLSNQYANSYVIHDFAAVTWYMVQLAHLQKKSLRNSISADRHQSYLRTQEIIKELLYFADLVVRDLGDSRIANYGISSEQELPSFTSFLGVLQTAQTHVVDNSDFFDGACLESLRPHASYPQHGFHPSLPPHWGPLDDRPLTPVEKLGVILSVALVAYGAVRWHFNRTIERRLDAVTNEVQEVDLNHSKIQHEFDNATQRVVNLEEKMKEALKQLSGIKTAGNEKCDKFRKEMEEYVVKIHCLANRAMTFKNTQLKELDDDIKSHEAILSGLKEKLAELITLTEQISALLVQR